jgi:hypothetical protein
MMMMMMPTTRRAGFIRVKGPRGEPPLFLRADDETTLNKYRESLRNTDIMQSVGVYASPDLDADQVRPLYFRILDNNPEITRENALRVVYSFIEIAGVPQEYFDIVYNSGTFRTQTGKCGFVLHPKDDYARAHMAEQSHPAGRPKGTRIIPTEIVIRIPAIVFGNSTSDLTPHINYQLSRDLVQAGIGGVDIDVYQRHRFVRIPNSCRAATGLFGIPLAFDELLNLTPHRIATMALAPRAEESMIFPCEVPRVVEWFQYLKDQAQKETNTQKRLREMALDSRGKIPSCIARLKRAWNIRECCQFEAFRVLVGWYAWMKADSMQIRNALCRTDWGHQHQSNDGRLTAILTFAMENPTFAGCHHPLLQPYCTPEKCYMMDLIHECIEPHLFPLTPFKGDKT